jgi:hypothetical protein
VGQHGGNTAIDLVRHRRLEQFGTRHFVNKITRDDLIEDVMYGRKLPEEAEHASGAAPARVSPRISQKK